MNENATVLLAEDEINDVFLMERAVRRMKAPVKIQVARDGEEAIEYLSGHDKYSDRDLYPLPELILLDIKMPRKNGFDVLEWLKNSVTVPRIPVVMLTSSKVRTDVQRAHDLGASGYLVKPLDFHVLKELLTNTDAFLAVQTA